MRRRCRSVVIRVGIMIIVEEGEVDMVDEMSIEEEVVDEGVLGIGRVQSVEIIALHVKTHVIGAGLQSRGGMVGIHPPGDMVAVEVDAVVGEEKVTGCVRVVTIALDGEMYAIDVVLPNLVGEQEVVVVVIGHGGMIEVMIGGGMMIGDGMMTDDEIGVDLQDSLITSMIGDIKNI
mmetsp:Transcript_525/g.1228  ORF Transcript_525/g.1228 Transcript_525/m.1228 type:complete len:176 (+) Transcript_525:592-1119(+)